MLVVAAVLAGSSCAPQPIALSEDPLTRATTCTAVRALELRAGRAGSGPMSFDGFAEILHFGMIHAAEDDVEVDLRRLVTVSHRAPMLMQQLEAQEWRTLVEPCNAAYPQTQRSAPPLPGDTYEAGMTCFALADFIGKTAVDYPGEQRAATALAEKALQAAQPTLRQRARDNQEAHRIAAGYAARAFKAGRPTSLLDQCRRRFAAAS